MIKTIKDNIRANIRYTSMIDKYYKILDALNMYGHLTRTQIMSLTGLARTTVYERLYDLYKKYHVVDRVIRHDGSIGRPVVMWKIKMWKIKD